jgi:predicted ATPase
MKILKLDVNGFRSLKHVQWEPGALNVLIGPNASGKSNLMRSLELVSAAATGKLGGLVQEAGGMGAICWDDQKNATVSFCLKTSSVKAGEDIERERLTYDVELSRLGEGASYRVNTEQLANYRAVEQGKLPSPFKFLDRRRGSAHVYDETKKEDGKAKGLVRVPDDALQDDETILSVAGNPIVGSFLQNHVLTDYQRHLAGWSVYHAFGSHPESIIRRPLVVRHEKRVSPDGANLVSVLQTLYNSSRDFPERIDDAMSAAFPDCYEKLRFQTVAVADQRVQLAVQFSGLDKPTAAAGLSDGTLRFLFLLTILGSSEAVPLIAVDEPEIGLHPSMLSIVAEFAVEASRHSQVIISTHSEALLNAFGETRPTTTVVRWNQGETSLTNLDDNQLADWLKSYSLGALFASGELENVQ